jgi:hypothetical protein
LSLYFDNVSWLPFKIDTAWFSESLKMPATAVGSRCDVEAMGVLGALPGVEAPPPPVIVRGTAFSMLEMWEAREPFSFVTERSQSDLPVEMTTWVGSARCYQINNTITFLPHYCSEEDELVGGRASRIPAYQKSCLSSMKFFPDTPHVLWRPY